MKRRIPNFIWKGLLCICLTVFFHQQLDARVVSTKGNGQSKGNWGSTSMWIGGVLPTDGDTVLIRNGDSININANFPATGCIAGIQDSGILAFSVGRKLKMYGNAEIYVYDGGKINGGSSGSKFDFHNPFCTSVINSISGPFTVSGPSYATGSSTSFTPTPLPVDLLSFEATLSGLQIQLNWSTTNESGEFYFEIQRSKNLEDWESLGFVKDAAFRGEINRYQFATSSMNNGTFYFRLKIVEINGIAKYSEIRAVQVQGIAQFQISPNPARSVANVWVDGEQTGTLKVINTLGQVVQIQEVKEGQKQIDLNLAGLESGVYTVEFSSRGERSVKRLCIN